jgi:signal transduction histidine kinase
MTAKSEPVTKPSKLTAQRISSLAFVSHELRSPLNAILGWAKILLTKTVDDKTRRNALETIERSAGCKQN